MSETLRWPWWFWFLVLGLDFSIVIALWAGLGNISAIIGLLVVVIISFWMYFFTSLHIEVNDNLLRVGRAKIEKKFIGEVTPLDSVEMSHHLRSGINPSAFHAVRFWVKTGVRIQLKDPRDPTPYWLISTHQANKLAQILMRKEKN